MKEIVVISGKGGTGKTSIVASFAALAKNAVMADCDVDAADLHLVLTPEIKQEENFSGGKRARILSNRCLGCGACADLCRFNAISREDGVDSTAYRIDPVNCEGCGVCAWFCFNGAIEFEETINGRLFISDTRYGPMVHAKLGIAEENSGKLVTMVRKKAWKIGERENLDHVICDGAPGIGCPVIASIGGADVVLIVTEPTVSGEHDLERVADLTKHFGIPASVCINKCDLNDEITERIGKRAEKRGVSVVGRIPYDKVVTEAQTNRVTVVEYTDSLVSREIENVWRQLI